MFDLIEKILEHETHALQNNLFFSYFDTHMSQIKIMKTETNYIL